MAAYCQVYGVIHFMSPADGATCTLHRLIRYSVAVHFELWCEGTRVQISPQMVVVYRDSHCDIQPSPRTVHLYCSARRLSLPPSMEQ